MSLHLGDITGCVRQTQTPDTAVAVAHRHTWALSRHLFTVLEFES